MAKQLQLRRGTTVQHSTFTGAVGEVTIDTNKDVVVVHDGTTAGGFPSQKELISGTNIKTINNSTILGSGNLDIVSAGMITGGTTNQVLAKNSSTDYDTKWYSVQEPLVSGTNIKTVNSTSLLGSGDVEVQPTLVSGTNIKTINSTSLLGSGNISITETAWVSNDSRAKTALNATDSAPIYACRAWVNFNGTGTVAIKASGNVSSITDNGAGDYTVNFTTAMPDAYYSYSQSANKGTDGGYPVTINETISTPKTTTALRVTVQGQGSSFGNFEPSSASIQIIR